MAVTAPVPCGELEPSAPPAARRRRGSPRARHFCRRLTVPAGRSSGLTGEGATWLRESREGTSTKVSAVGSDRNATSSRPWRFRWEDAVRRQSKLPLPAIAVLLNLSSYGDPDGSNVRPTQERVADDLGVDLRTVQRWLKVAHEGGWLTTVTKGRPGRANVYGLTMPNRSDPSKNLSPRLTHPTAEDDSIDVGGGQSCRSQDDGAAAAGTTDLPPHHTNTTSKNKSRTKGQLQITRERLPDEHHDKPESYPSDFQPAREPPRSWFTVTDGRHEVHQDIASLPSGPRFVSLIDSVLAAGVPPASVFDQADRVLCKVLGRNDVFPTESHLVRCLPSLSEFVAAKLEDVRVFESGESAGGGQGDHSVPDEWAYLNDSELMLHPRVLRLADGMRLEALVMRMQFADGCVPDAHVLEQLREWRPLDSFPDEEELAQLVVRARTALRRND